MNKFFKYLGWVMLIIGVWLNGFMFGAIDRIIEGTSRVEFNTNFIQTFIVIIIGIIFMNFLKNKKESKGGKKEDGRKNKEL